MKELLLHTLTFAYGSVGLLTLIAYWPTVYDLYHHKRPSANVSTYLLWTIASGIGFMYGLCILPDPLFLLVAGTNFFANTIVLLLRMRLPR